MEHKEIKLRIPWPTIRSVGFNFRRLLPTPGNVIFTLTMIALLVAAQTAGALPLGRTQTAPAAASTGTIAYQGRLADAAGAPLTGTYNMIFRLYDVTTGGTPLWSEQWTGSNGVRVSDGLFNVMLGSLAQLPMSQLTNAQSLFLGITVGTDDEMAPRVQLGSVPFAVQALTVPDGSVTTGKIADGAVTGAKLGADVSLVPPDGSVTTAKLADGAITAPKLSLTDSFTVRQGNSDYKTVIGGRQIDMQDGGNFPGLTHMHTYWNTLWLWTDQGSVYIGGPNGEKEDFVVTGAKSAVVDTSSYGQRKLYAIEAPDVRFSDEGMARLQGGVVRIEIDPIFLETIEGEYLVHVTPYGDASLYVAGVGQDYFVVKAREGDPNAAFAWRLSATRKGYGGVRLEEVK
jgi:hypothetical protein